MRRFWMGCVLASLPALPSQAAEPSPAPEILKPGEIVAAFDASDVFGTPTRVEYPKTGATVLLFFSAGCPTCHRMIPEWTRAYARRPKGLAVHGILVDREPPGFFVAMGITFPVLRSPGAEFNRRYKLQRVPYMVRVGPSGKVEDAVVGLLDPIRLGEIFRP